jgi:hypothetical protein
MQFLTKAGLALPCSPAGTLAGAGGAGIRAGEYHTSAMAGSPPASRLRPAAAAWLRSPTTARPGLRSPARGCDPRLAEDMARDYGFRRARVVDVSRRVASSFRAGHVAAPTRLASATFAVAQSCVDNCRYNG